ncbi:MAG: chromosomal replication initiator protein DnaA [Neisseriaceae bacterium]
MEDFTNFWLACVGRLKQDMDPYQFNRWVPLLTATQREESWYLYAPTQFILSLVREHCLPKINAVREEFSPTLPLIVLEVGKGELRLVELGQEERCVLALEDTLVQSSKQGEGVVQSVTKTSNKEECKEDRRPQISDQISGGFSYEKTRLKSGLTFVNLVVGKSNRIAYSVGLAVSEELGKKDYNPLFVYGSTGLGKTHLVQAIANRVFLEGQSSRIRYIHAEKFINDFVKYVRKSDIDGFKRAYQELDLLILDDVQFIAGKEKTMEEFFYLFNQFIDRDKQIILTSDRLPTEIKELDKRLISRFSWGLTVQIEPPELEMRVAILHKKADLAGFRLPEDIAFFIAQNIKSNVRDLEGALNRVKAHSKFTHEPLSIELVKTALKDILAAGREQLTIHEIQRVVADYYNVKLSDLKGTQRSRKIVRPRQIAMSIAKDLTEQSLPSIGAAFGGKDHTTVIYAHRTILKLRQKDRELEHEYNTLVNTLSQVD